MWTRESLHRRKEMDRLPGAILRTMFQMWQCLKDFLFPTFQHRRRATDCGSQVPQHQETGREQFFNPMTHARRIQTSGDHWHFPGVQALGDLPHTVREWLEPHEEGLFGEPRDSHNVVVEQLVVEPKETTPDEMRVRFQEEGTYLLDFAERSKRPSIGKPTGRHNVFTHVPQKIKL